MARAWLLLAVRVAEHARARRVANDGDLAGGIERERELVDRRVVVVVLELLSRLVEVLVELVDVLVEELVVPPAFWHALSLLRLNASVVPLNNRWISESMVSGKLRRSCPGPGLVSYSICPLPSAFTCSTPRSMPSMMTEYGPAGALETSICRSGLPCSSTRKSPVALPGNWPQLNRTASSCSTVLADTGGLSATMTNPRSRGRAIRVVHVVFVERFIFFSSSPQAFRLRCWCLPGLSNAHARE